MKRKEITKSKHVVKDNFLFRICVSKTVFSSSSQENRGLAPARASDKVIISRQQTAVTAFPATTQ